MGMLLAAAVIGGAIDFSRYWRTQNALQAACDAGVLAGRRAVTTDGYDDTALAAASKFFKVNFTQASDATDATFTSSSDDDGATVVGVASYTLDTVVMRLFGFDTFSLTANCSASMGVGNADVMMVLDVTGSMSSQLSNSTTTRLAALKTAVKNFYVTLSGATTGSNARIRYGFVPYSSTVNVGKLLYNLDPDYIVDSHAYQSRVPYFIDYTDMTDEGSSTSTGSTTTTTSNGKTNYSSLSACNSALASYTASGWTNSGSASDESYTTGTSSGSSVTVTGTSTQDQSSTTYQCVKSGQKYVIQTVTQTRTVTTTTTYLATYTNVPTSNSTFDHWVYQSVDYDTSKFKTFASTTSYTGSSGASVDSTWDGCIEERGTEAASSFSYSSLTGYSPSDAYDIDIDTIPDSDDTKWAPLWYQVEYTRSSTASVTTTSNCVTGSCSNSNSGGGKGGNNSSSSSSGDSAMYEYCPVAAQALEEMDQDDFDAYADTLTATGSTYLDVGMVWGGRLLSPDGIYSDLVNEAPSNGGEVSRHIIFMTDGDMNPSESVYSAWGIENLDLRVTDAASETQDTTRRYARLAAICTAIKAKGIRIWAISFATSMSDELSNCASDDSTFEADDGDELDAAFQEIAKEVGELRIVQ